MNKWLIVFCAFIVFVSACIDDESKIDKFAAGCAAGNQEACKKIADIAKNDQDSGVRRAAVEKLTDQKILAGIAKKDKDIDVRRAAVEKLTDQSVLAKIALEDLSLGDNALGKLKEQASLNKIAVDDKDWRVRLILKFISAFDSVPTEHRERLMMKVLPAVRVFVYPAVISLVGDVVSIKTEWDGISRDYIGYGLATIEGEIFTCSIKVQKLAEPLSHWWKTSFPYRTSSFGFLSANVNAHDFVRELFENIYDQMLLTDIAKNDMNTDVRRAAFEKLTDHALLAEIAGNDKDRGIREAAAKILTYQAQLAKDAKDNDWYFRLKAARELTDLAVLADIAKNDKDLYVRGVAKRRLKKLQGI